MLLITTIAFFVAWLLERNHRKYEAARADAFEQLSVKLKERLRATINHNPTR